MEVVFAHPAFLRFEALLRERLDSEHSVRFAGVAECGDPHARFEETEVLVTARFPKEWAPRFPALKLLHAAGAGLDKVEVSALPSGARVCCTFGHGASIAEFVIMVMLALLRGLLPADRELRRDHWVNPLYHFGLPLPDMLEGKTVVIVGTGEIGCALAKLAPAFRARCVGINRTGRRDFGGVFDRVEPLAALYDVLPEADFLIVAVPLTDETRGLIGEKELSLLKPAAYLVNVARGPVVEEAALFHALRNRALAGAAIDVWYNYASADSDRAEPSRFPFRDLDNVIMTPHFSGITHATFRHRAEDVAGNILALAAGRPLRNEVIRAPSASR
ncbi:MAG: 2-hydroxyacid dehydrogenase [Opitutaceae bacterium]